MTMQAGDLISFNPPGTSLIRGWLDVDQSIITIFHPETFEPEHRPRGHCIYFEKKDIVIFLGVKQSKTHDTEYCEVFHEGQIYLVKSSFCERLVK